MLSVIIPAKNEEKYLPLLIDSIAKQKFPSLEIIVSDASSSDNTCKIANEYCCRVVEGGIIAKGRNSGARIAKGDIFLFIDADVILPENYVKTALSEFHKRKLDIAGTLQAPIPTNMKRKNFLYKLFYGTANMGMKLMQKSSRPFMQVCMFVKKQVHEDICGFDEKLIFAEDSEYAVRAVQSGYKFGILKTAKVKISPRRFEDKKSIKLAIIYLLLNLTRLLGFEHRKNSFFRKCLLNTYGKNYFDNV
jgi:glycosyltransferase involved in cell wall biosynthesis